jgi:DNA-binding transcriptional LysR family regulator
MTGFPKAGDRGTRAAAALHVARPALGQQMFDFETGLKQRRL